MIFYLIFVAHLKAASPPVSSLAETKLLMSYVPS